MKAIKIVCIFILILGSIVVTLLLTNRCSEKNEDVQSDVLERVCPSEEREVAINDEEELRNRCRHFLKDAKVILERRDVTFTEIHALRREYEENYTRMIFDDANQTLCDKIMAYDNLATSIEQGKVDAAKLLAREPLIDKQHAFRVAYLDDRNIAGVTSFAEIREPLVSTPVASSAPVTKPSTPSMPPAARSTGTTGLVQSKGWNGKPAYICKDNIAAGGKKGCGAMFLDKEGLLNHIKKGLHENEK